MKKRKKMSWESRMGFLFVIPAAIYMMIFIGYPIIQNILLSFKNVDIFTFARPEQQQFIGFQNYIELFTNANSTHEVHQV